MRGFSDKCRILKINLYMPNFSPKSSHVLLLPGRKVHFTDKKYFDTVLYAYMEENFDNKLIFEKISIKTKENFLH